MRFRPSQQPTCDRSPKTPGNQTEFVDLLTCERLFEPVEELRGGAFMTAGAWIETTTSSA